MDYRSAIGFAQIGHIIRRPGKPPIVEVSTIMSIGSLTEPNIPMLQHRKSELVVLGDNGEMNMRVVFTTEDYNATDWYLDDEFFANIETDLWHKLEIGR